MRDAMVIGGGHNGPVCAWYLARAGLGATVPEARCVVGGAAREVLRDWRRNRSL